MTQPTKKTSAHTAASKVASTANNIAGKAAKNTYAAVESTRASAENVVKIGSTAVKDFIANGASEAQKAQEKAFALGRESAENFAKSADAATKVIHDSLGMSRENIETAMECGNITAALTKDVSSELFDYANRAFSDNVELSRDFFACRTINDIFELQNRMVKNNLDNFFSQSVKLSSLFFEYTNEALEPINERVSQATEQLSKTLAA